jgi:hypothetical protein
MGLLTIPYADLDTLGEIVIDVEITSQDGTMLAGTGCACEAAITAVGDGSLVHGVYGGTGQWSGSAQYRLGDEISIDLFRLRSANRFQFYATHITGSVTTRIPIGTLAVSDFSSLDRVVAAELVGLESVLANSRIPAQIDLYPATGNERWTAEDTACFLANRADPSMQIDGDATPRKLSAQVEQPTFAEIFEQGAAWWSAILETVTPYGIQPMINRFGSFTLNRPPARPGAGVKFAFDDSTLISAEPAEDGYTPLGAIVTADYANVLHGDATGSAWMDREGSVSPAFADSRDPVHSTYVAPTTAEFNVTGASTGELLMLTESLSGLFDSPEFLQFTTSSPQLLDIGDHGWVRSVLRDVDAMYRIVEIAWSWGLGGKNPQTTFQAQRVAE